MRVLHVLNSAFGGSALSTLQLIDALKVHGVSSSLVCLNNGDAATREAIHSCVEGRVLFIPLYWTNKRIRAKWWKRPLLDLIIRVQTGSGHRFQPAISDLIRRESVQLVHTSTLVNNEGAIAAVNNQIPHVWHARELIGTGTYYEFPQPAKWVDYVMNHSACLIANSRITKKNLEGYFPEERIRYIPNGIPITGYSMREHRKGECVVGMIGNVTSSLKNHKAFLQAAIGLRDCPWISFRIYGALPDEHNTYLSDLRRMIVSNGIQDRVRFMGHVDDVPSIVRDLDILFHPTEHESFGRIFIEAMAGGVPVLGIRGGGGEEMIVDGRNGYLVDGGQVHQASLLIRQLAEDPGRRAQFGKEGRQTVENSYDIRLTASRIFNLYGQIIDSQKVNQA